MLADPGHRPASRSRLPAARPASCSRAGLSRADESAGMAGQDGEPLRNSRRSAPTKPDFCLIESAGREGLS
jgi:hypothetical protein